MSDELANGMHDDLPPLHDPRHVALNARDVMRPCGWAKSKGYQNLKDRNLVAPPVMTHPDRWRLARFLRPLHASDALYAAEPEITADSAWRVTARQLYLRRAFAKAASRSVTTGKFAALFEERAEVLESLQPQISYLLDVAEVQDPNMRRFWQQGELTTAVARMEDQGVPIWLQPTQMVELAKATHHEVTNALGKALHRELLRADSNLRNGNPRHAEGPVRVGRRSLDATLTDPIDMPAPKLPVAQFKNPLQRAALRRTLDITPIASQPPSPFPAARSLGTRLRPVRQGNCRVSSVQAGLQSRRRTVGQQPPSSSTGNTTTAAKPGKTATQRSHPPTDQCAAQPDAMPGDSDGVARFDALLAADQVAPWLAPAEDQPGTRTDSPAGPGMRD